MSWPERIYCSEKTWPRLDFFKMGNLTFMKPDHAKSPIMDLSYSAGRAGGTMTGVLSAANEKAAELFLEERIGYLDIVKVIEMTCAKHREELVVKPTLEDILHYDGWACEYAAQVIESGSFRPIVAV
ncbi:hypothetical protein M758_9G133200 [Ceratodon purpureus]|nr:hypothetical protein M758_9G133200 [Ceratodon purpureus]